MTRYQAMRHFALNTTRDRFWMPLGGFRNFLDESIPEYVAMVIRRPELSAADVVGVLIDGWRWKNVAIQIGVEEIERAR